MATISESEPISIGVLFSETGITSVVEQTQRDAVSLAVSEINARRGAGNFELRPIFLDPASDPKRYEAEAENLISQGVRIIFGCYMSSARRAVLPVVERAGALLFYPTLYEGFEFSANCVYSGAAPNQNSLMLADYMSENFGKRHYFVGSNYVFPYESNRIMRDLLVARGCTVLEERYIPLNPKDDDIDQIIDEINKLEPDVIFSTVVGEGAIKLYQRYAQKGRTREKSPIMSLTTGEPEIAEMGVDAAEGHYTCAPYFSSLPRAVNQSFVTAYRSAFGAHAPISACTEAAYFQVHLFAEALKLGGPDAILQNLPLVEFDAPQGKVRVDRTTQHTFLTPRIGRVNPSGAFDIVYDHRTAVRPDPYKVEPEASGWSRFVGGA